MIINFPCEHSCLVWTKFTGSRFCNSGLHAANQRPISLHKQLNFSHLAQTNSDEVTKGPVFKTSTHRDYQTNIHLTVKGRKLREESPLLSSVLEPSRAVYILPTQT